MIGEMCVDSQYSSPLFFFVAQLALPLAAGKDRAPQLRVHLGGRLTGSQNARILAADFVKTITGRLGEAWVDVFDVAGRVGDDDRGRTVLDGARQLTQRLFCPGALGDLGVQLFDGQVQFRRQIADALLQLLVRSLQSDFGALTRAQISAERHIQHQHARQHQQHVKPRECGAIDGQQVEEKVEEEDPRAEEESVPQGSSRDGLPHGDLSISDFRSLQDFGSLERAVRQSPRGRLPESRSPSPLPARSAAPGPGARLPSPPASG